MAETSEVKSGLDNIAEVISANRAVIAKAKTNAQAAADALNAIPVDYADVATTIDAYTGADQFEVLAQAEKSRLIAEYQALKAIADAIVAAA